MNYAGYCSLTYNGVLIDQEIDGYTTINVEGRGLHGRVLSTVDVQGKDGAVVLAQKTPARSIRVYFLIKANTSREFMARLHALHDHLKSDTDVAFKFSDEEFNRRGRLSEVENPPYDRLQGIGSFTVYCQDPYKYGDDLTLTGTSVAVGGTSVHPYLIKKIEITIAANRTGLTIANSTTGKSIILTGEFTAGQVLAISHADDAITLNGANIKNRLDYIYSDWRNFEIRTGDVLTCPETIELTLTEREL